MRINNIHSRLRRWSVMVNLQTKPFIFGFLLGFGLRLPLLLLRFLVLGIHFCVRRISAAAVFRVTRRWRGAGCRPFASGPRWLPLDFLFGCRRCFGLFRLLDTFASSLVVRVIATCCFYLSSLKLTCNECNKKASVYCKVFL